MILAGHTVALVARFARQRRHRSSGPVKGATKELRRLVTSKGHLWHKTSKTRVEVYDDVTSGELSRKTPVRTISGLKDTRWDYDTGEESTFEMSGAVDEEDDGRTEREKDIRTAVRAVVRQKMTYREAATLTDYGKDWVGDRVREWRNGDHETTVGFAPQETEE